MRSIFRTPFRKFLQSPLPSRLDELVRLSVSLQASTRRTTLKPVLFFLRYKQLWAGVRFFQTTGCLNIRWIDRFTIAIWAIYCSIIGDLPSDKLASLRLHTQREHPLGLQKLRIGVRARSGSGTSSKYCLGKSHLRICYSCFPSFHLSCDGGIIAT